LYKKKWMHRKCIHFQLNLKKNIYMAGSRRGEVTVGTNGVSVITVPDHHILGMR
jgi:hypothetical protein